MPYTEKDRKEHIKELQQYLRYIDIHNGKSGIIPDGIYGENTRNSVTEFQKNKGFEPTGIVDNETWDSIIEEYNLIIPFYETPSSIFPFRDNFSVIKKGDTGDVVYFIQIMLSVMKKDDIPYPKIDGIYGDETEEAVKKYQSLSGLTPTGETDIFTWNNLSENYSGR